MGLDMFLSGETYYGRWSRDAAAFNALNDSPLVAPARQKGLAATGITFELGYWRKANQVHRWFVNNVQDGVDDCRPYHVDPEALLTLLEVCKGLLEAKKVLAPDELMEKVMEELPPQSGFFFGSTKVDENYWEDIEHTVKTIENLELDKTSSFFRTMDIYYQASW